MIFEVEKINMPYESFDEQLEDCLNVLDLYLQYASWFQNKEMNGMIEEKVGVDVKSAWEYFIHRIPEKIENQDNLLYLIFHQLYQNTFQRLCFLLGLGIRIDCKYERIMSRLEMCEEEKIPTLGSVFQLVSATEKASLVEVLTLPQLGLYWDFIFESKDRGLSTRLKIRESVYFAMLGKGMMLKTII